ncbi:MAG: AlpA family phage regulatory protein [Nocardiopsaceae bacterium]|nr:AlpA family phage regulatory protein [Nocardiopsaceae bacterium]
MATPDDTLLDITDIRRIFKLGRTAAYELTHRPEFPGPIAISPRCYRWWASEVAAFAAALRQEPARTSAQRTRRPCLPDSATAPRRITGRVRAARNRKEGRYDRHDHSRPARS